MVYTKNFRGLYQAVVPVFPCYLCGSGVEHPDVVAGQGRVYVQPSIIKETKEKGVLNRTCICFGFIVTV